MNKTGTLINFQKQKGFTGISSVHGLNVSFKANADDDEDDDDMVMKAPQNIHLPYFQNTHTLRKITAYLDENIRESKYYRPLIQGMNSLSEHDSIELYIDSYGGSLDGAVSIINAIDNCDAKVNVVITGVAASAASMIALSAPSIYVGPYATMMIHSASFGSFGKQSDVISHASFIDKRVKTLMGNIYKDFLTDSEMNEVFMGREIWLSNEELISRLQTRNEIQQARLQAEQEEEETKPRKSRK